MFLFFLQNWHIVANLHRWLLCVLRQYRCFMFKNLLNLQCCFLLEYCLYLRATRFLNTRLIKLYIIYKFTFPNQHSLLRIITNLNNTTCFTQNSTIFLVKKNLLWKVEQIEDWIWPLFRYEFISIYVDYIKQHIWSCIHIWTYFKR